MTDFLITIHIFHEIVSGYYLFIYLNLQHFSKLPLSPQSQSSYQLISSSNTVIFVVSFNISTLPHCQVGDKEGLSDNRDCVIVEVPTHIIYVLKSNCD